MDDDVVFFAMVQRYNIYFKYVSLRHDIWIVMVLSHPRRISTEPKNSLNFQIGIQENMPICHLLTILNTSPIHQPRQRKSFRNGYEIGRTARNSRFITHLVNVFNVDDVISRNNTFVKKIYFEKVIDRIIENIIGL